VGSLIRVGGVDLLSLKTPKPDSNPVYPPHLRSHWCMFGLLLAVLQRAPLDASFSLAVDRYCIFPFWSPCCCCCCHPTFPFSVSSWAYPGTISSSLYHAPFLTTTSETDTMKNRQKSRSGCRTCKLRRVRSIHHTCHFRPWFAPHCFLAPVRAVPMAPIGPLPRPCQSTKDPPMRTPQTKQTMDEIRLTKPWCQ